jgi:hypothetical protein
MVSLMCSILRFRMQIWRRCGTAQILLQMFFVIGAFVNLASQHPRVPAGAGEIAPR